MESKALYQNILDLISFAKTLQAAVSIESAYTNQYFMSLVYIEDILDGYGRVMLHENAKQNGMTDEQVQALQQQANTCLDSVRHTLRTMVQTEGYDNVVQSKCTDLVNTWQKCDNTEQ